MTAEFDSFKELNKQENSHSINPLQDEFIDHCSDRNSRALLRDVVPGNKTTDVPRTSEKLPEQRIPTITKLADGRIRIVGEAEITVSAKGDMSLKRTDKSSTSFEVKHNNDGGLTYTHSGHNKNDNFTCTVTPDGKGGNKIKWEQNNNQQKLEYHWSPKNNLPNKKATTEIPTEQPGIREHILARAAIPDNSGVLITDNGKGAQIRRIDAYIVDRSGKTVGGPEFNTIFTDKQGNKITFEETGKINIENTKTHAQYSFVQFHNGYHMSSNVPTNDNIIEQSYIDQVKSTSWNNGITVKEYPTGLKETIREDPKNNSINRSQFSDGTTKTTQYGDDGSISTWTSFPDYPKGAFLYHKSTGDEMTYHDGAINKKTADEVKTLSLSKKKQLESKYDISISSDSDPVALINGKKLSFRTPTLKELQILETALEKFPLNKKENMQFGFFKDKADVKADEETLAFYVGNGLIGINPINPSVSPDQWLGYHGGNTGVFAGNTLESTLLHELGHHSSYRRDIKAWDSGIVDHVLAEKYGFSLINDTLRHKRSFVVQGEEITNGQKHTFYYKPGPDLEHWLRIDSSGRTVSKEGKLLSSHDEQDFINNIKEVAKVQLPSNYAYSHPAEAEAEVLTLYRLNEQSKAYLLAMDKKYNTSLYAQAQADDQGEIERFMPADEVNPNGFMRIPSGKIVPKTAENEQLVLDFIRKHN